MDQFATKKNQNICQNCLQEGHFTKDCHNKRVYQYRPIKNLNVNQSDESQNSEENIPEYNPNTGKWKQNNRHIQNRKYQQQIYKYKKKSEKKYSKINRQQQRKSETKSLQNKSKDSNSSFTSSIQQLKKQNKNDEKRFMKRFQKIKKKD